MQRILIAAIGKNGELGKDDYMPWHYPEDLKRFMRVTSGHTVVMGRKTFEGMWARGKAPLANRRNIIITRSPENYQEAFSNYPKEQLDFTCSVLGLNLQFREDEKVFYCGGAQIYSEIIDHVQSMHLSRFQESYAYCDAFFPADPKSFGVFQPYIPEHLKLISEEEISGKTPFKLQTYA